MSSTLSSPTETVASPFSRDATIDAGAGEPRSRRPPPRLGLRTVPTAPARDASQQSPLLSLPSARPFSASDIDGDGSPGFHAELALLESLRMDVRRNLSLRPLRNSPLQQPPPPQPPFHQPARPNPPPLVISDRQQVSPPRSSGHAVAAAVALGSSSSTSSPSLSVSSSSTLSSPCGLTPFHSPRKAPSADDAGDLPGGGYSPFSHSSGAPVLPSSINETTHSPRKALIMPPPDNINPHARATRPCALDPPQLYNILCAPSPQPHLILDTRPSASFLKRHIQHSINLDLGSLISRHGSRNPLESIMALRDFIAYGLQYWDTLMATTPRRRWDGDVILIDDNMTVEPTKSAPDKNHGGASYSLNSPVPREVARSDDASSTAWTFLTMLLPLTRGQVYFPQGGSSALSTALYAQLVRGSTVAAAAIRSGSEGSGSPGVDPSSKGTITASEKEDPEKVISRPPPRGAFTTRPSELSAIKTQAKPTTKDAAAANQRGMDTVSSSSRPAVAPVAVSANPAGAHYAH
ncbi:hypothetical protein BOTBODRAFT_462499 [Botryobasidium botryosum FD-172 SS1]|uniref:Rhodanese domain-containing protein n=1 Tax=Botryobasidium botryosum (strain FD-172 SS1) TaxID=930990 RepID=A0A067M945_BOTB1|nr:hypothetical protein BOTBODRAFT_462499 [Botryobasidium botryosum FD-172 SS1]